MHKDAQPEAGPGNAVWRQYIRSHLPTLNVSAEREVEIIEELAVQLESIYERARSGGASDDEAMRLAVAEVPDWTAFARTVAGIETRYVPPPAAGATTGGFMTGFIQDIRYALRALSRAPGFAAVSIITLALGIAATTIVYSLVDGILLRPLPIVDPDRVMLAREAIDGEGLSLSVPNYRDFRARQTSFASFAAWRGLTANLTGIGEPRRLNVRHITSDLFSTLGVKVVLGRDFTADDDKFGVDRTAIISYGFWQRELGGSSDAIGRRIMLDESPVTVIGVLPKDFTVARVEDVFLPFGTYVDPNSGMYMGRGNHFGLTAVGRLKPGVTRDAANAEMIAIARQLEQEYPNTNSGNSGIVQPLFETLVSTARPMLYVLLAAVIAMLLIACVNLANLMLSRASGRAQEMAVRRSLGAARWRIARQMLTESLLLAVLGGAAGVALAYGGFEAIVALLPPGQPRIHIISIDGRVLLMAAAASIATGVLFGLMPAIQAATGRSMTLLRSARVTGAAHAGAGTRRTLMLAEVALALVLVTGAGLMLRTMNNLAAIETGFNRDQITTASFNLPQRYDTERRLIFLDQSLQNIRAIPGVSKAAFTYSIPVMGSNWNSIFIIEGQPVPERSQLPNSAWIPVSNEYFDTMGIALVKGRWFDNRDIPKSPDVVIVNETFARRFFGDNDPIGARVKQGWPEDKTPWRQIVGVVRDVRMNSLQGDPSLQAYLPVGQVGQRSGAFVVRSAGSAATLGRAIEAAVHKVDPNLPLFNIETMNQIIDGAIGNERLTMVLLMGFAALALLMAAIGVFGVTAYSVSQRTHELGIRMALGANRGSVLALVLRQEMTACLIGIVIGVVGAFFMASLLESLLFGVTPRDGPTLAIAALGLLAVTMIACVIPAHRATRVDPVAALRLE
ncbi:MAG TPA: ABC transporter permease [Vicinamibacterales bacterium]|nr:ABC transporter permease [Vicinamibacterales bacterium]